MMTTRLCTASNNGGAFMRLGKTPWEDAAGAPIAVLLGVRACAPRVGDDLACCRLVHSNGAVLVQRRCRMCCVGFWNRVRNLLPGLPMVATKQPCHCCGSCRCCCCDVHCKQRQSHTVPYRSASVCAPSFGRRSKRSRATVENHNLDARACTEKSLRTTISDPVISGLPVDGSRTTRFRLGLVGTHTASARAG